MLSVSRCGILFYTWGASAPLHESVFSGGSLHDDEGAGGYAGCVAKGWGGRNLAERCERRLAQFNKVATITVDWAGHGGRLKSAILTAIFKHTCV